MWIPLVILTISIIVIAALRFTKPRRAPSEPQWESAPAPVATTSVGAGRPRYPVAHVIQVGTQRVIDLTAVDAGMLADGSALMAIEEQLCTLSSSSVDVWVVPQATITWWFEMSEMALIVILGRIKRAGTSSGPKYLYTHRNEPSPQVEAIFKGVGIEAASRWTLVDPERDAPLEIEGIIETARAQAPEASGPERPVLGATFLTGALLHTYVAVTDDATFVDLRRAPASLDPVRLLADVEASLKRPAAQDTPIRIWFLGGWQLAAWRGQEAEIRDALALCLARGNSRQGERVAVSELEGDGADSVLKCFVIWA
ncbi:hypothetical protein BH09MYX1_BH09MYX1_02110 [soil metagenome]